MIHRENIEEFEILNIPIWQEHYTGKGIKIAILGVGEDKHHNGKDLMLQAFPDLDVIEYNIYRNEEDNPKISWEEALQNCLDKDVDVICSSMAKHSWSNDCKALSKLLYDKGVIMIDSADNEGEIIDAYPALDQHWFVVGDYNKRKSTRYGHSNYGPKLDFLSFTNLYSKTEYGSYIPISHTSGTSQLSSAMAGILKLHLWQNKFPPKEFKEYLKYGCIDLEEKGRDDNTGCGLFILPPEVEEVKKVSDFKDVAENHWAKDEIDLMVEEKLMQGLPDKSFGENKPLTRAEYAEAMAKHLEIHHGIK